MKKIVSFRGRDLIDRNTDISKPKSRGSWWAGVMCSLPLVATLLVGLTLLLLLPADVRADSFTVTDLKDEGSANPSFCTNPRYKDRFCTLRGAINAANKSWQSNKQSNTIYLPHGDYKLGRPLPPTVGSLVISGDGSDATKIWGPCTTNRREESNGHCVPFTQFPSSILTIAEDAHLRLAEMTIQGGFKGGDEGEFGVGGILNEGGGHLELVRVTVMGNGTHTGAGGILSKSGSTVLLDRSTVRDNFSHHGPGAGIVIEPDSTVTIIDSTISGNQVVVSDECDGGCGGGIQNRGLLVIQNSTLSGNRTLGINNFNSSNIVSAGGILNQGTDGEDSNLSHNGEAWLKSVTITANEGVIGSKSSTGGVNNAGGKFHFFNTIIAGNHGGESGLVPDCLGDLISLRGNLVGDPGFRNGTVPCTVMDWPSLPSSGAPRDQIGRKTTQSVISIKDIFVTDSFSVPLLNNNGGHTCTVALCSDGSCLTLRNSRAANAAWPNSAGRPFACEANDQRAAARGSSCDIGAFETGTPSPLFLPGLQCSGLEELKK